MSKLYSFLIDALYLNVSLSDIAANPCQVVSLTQTRILNITETPTLKAGGKSDLFKVSDVFSFLGVYAGHMPCYETRRHRKTLPAQP
jgi:hypothetical protein